MLPHTEPSTPSLSDVPQAIAQERKPAPKTVIGILHKIGLELLLKIIPARFISQAGYYKVQQALSGIGGDNAIIIAHMQNVSSLIIQPLRGQLVNYGREAKIAPAEELTLTRDSTLRQRVRVLFKSANMASLNQTIKASVITQIYMGLMFLPQRTRHIANRMVFYPLMNIPMTFGLLSLQAAMNLAMGWKRNGFVTVSFILGSVMATAGSELFKNVLPGFETLVAAGSLQCAFVATMLNGGLIWFYRQANLSQTLCDSDLTPEAQIKAKQIIAAGQPQLWLLVLQNCSDFAIRTFVLAEAEQIAWVNVLLPTIIVAGFAGDIERYYSVFVCDYLMDRDLAGLMRMRRISMVVAGSMGVGIWAILIVNKDTVIKFFYSASTDTDEVTPIIHNIYPWMMALPIWQLMNATARGVYIGINKCVKESAIVNIIGSALYFLVGISVNEGALGFAISMNAALCATTLIQYLGADRMVQAEFDPEPIGYASLLSRCCFWRQAPARVAAQIELVSEPAPELGLELTPGEDIAPVGYASRITFFAKRIKTAASTIAGWAAVPFTNCRKSGVRLGGV